MGEGLVPSPPEWWLPSAQTFARQSAVLTRGAYGILSKAVDTSGNKSGFLIKHPREADEDCLDEFCELQMQRAALYEAGILKDFKHPNIVGLLDFHFDCDDWYLAFQGVSMTLHSALKAQQEALPLETLRKYSKDLLLGLSACAERGIVHRDVSSRNIFLCECHGASQNATLKLGDFEFAIDCCNNPRPDLNEVLEVGTLWYRAPELLLGNFRGAACLRTKADCWSAGCIIAEMAMLKALFPADSQIGLIFQIFSLVGTPTDKDHAARNWHFWSDEFPVWEDSQLEPIREEYPELGEAGISLLRDLLVIDPKARSSAKNACAHNFFKE
mmetsp:Transcript_54506/g.129974  ORF Transcript_54506/g.129974 Transcript_54506/m.129974 type:complete len:328 (+) Transcript_54506:91-1074(+)